ncbi:MAG: hypothetical protein ACOYO1_10400 [Bacteroidales bacterium]
MHSFSNKILTIFIFYAIIPVLGFSQNKKVIRAEIETTETAKPFNIVNLGKNGVLILQRLNEFVDRKTQNWSFTLFNNTLQKKWFKKIPLSEDFSYQGFGFNNDTVQLVFYKDEKRSTENNLTIIKFELKKANYLIYDTLIPDKAKLSSLQFFQQIAFFTLESKTNISLIICDLEKKSFKDILTENADNMNIESVKIDTLNKFIYLLIKKEISKRENSLFLKKYDLSGNVISSIEITNEDPSRKLISGMITILNNERLCISGSYNLSDEKQSNYAETAIFSEAAGLYFMKIERNILSPIHFVNFLSFDNINKYLNKREVSKIKSIQENKTEKEFSLNYLLIEHEVLQKDNKIVLIAEALYPEYRVISDMSYDYYGRMTPTSRTIFDGYRYTNAFILSLDEDGNTKSKQLFDIWNILTMEIKEKVSVMPLKNELLLSYNDDGEIVYEKFSEDTSYNADIENLKIEMSYANDKAMLNSSANIDYWYGSYYLVYGVQTIKNNSLANRSKRTVFYMNKISFE